MTEDVRSGVERYYSDKVREHGATHAGVDWNSRESQELRFAQLMRVADLSRPFSLLDYGCGYGALLDWLEAQGAEVDYRGYDLSEEMVARAREAHPGATFTTDERALEPADVVVASGIFNVMAGAGEPAWRAYVADTIDRMDGLAGTGLAFNMLTSYSDADKMRPGLFYADPCEWFDRAKRRLSRHVALLHDYGLYEFTLLIRKDLG
ncbi:MAG TPA: class I SAM-dependent methyltransferase [Capillimicrobium sp.]|nr:class I SAM-dependent methyltransferase [Capillimicrobium sp.]